MSSATIGIPEHSEAAPYYFTYIDRIKDPDVMSVLEQQLDTTLDFARNISEERSLYRYAPEKWSIREMMAHLNDTERLMVFRAMWFARSMGTPLPSFDENISAKAAEADRVPLAEHVDEFQAIRSATLAFFRHLPPDAWMRKGIASDNPFTVRALAYIVAGHLSHSVAVLEERYLVPSASSA